MMQTKRQQDLEEHNFTAHSTQQWKPAREGGPSHSPMVEEEAPSVMPRLITFLSSVLQRVADSNDLISPIQSQKNSAFHGLTRPAISLHSYLERIFKYANCSNSCFIVAYVYLDRFAHRQPLLPINSYNVHRMLITSVLVAAKFMDDLCYNNAHYARVGGISTTEINFLEVDFLFGLGFHLNVTPNTFHTYYSCLQKEMLLLQPPLNSLTPETSVKGHLSFEEDEASHQKQQLAV